MTLWRLKMAAPWKRRWPLRGSSRKAPQIKQKHSTLSPRCSMDLVDIFKIWFIVFILYSFKSYNNKIIGKFRKIMQGKDHDTSKVSEDIQASILKYTS